MIDRIELSKIQDMLDKSASGQPDAPKTPPGSQADASLQVTYAALIEYARQTPETDEQAVQRARELLASGMVDTPDGVSGAAESIAAYGI